MYITRVNILAKSKEMSKYPKNEEEIRFSIVSTNKTRWGSSKELWPKYLPQVDHRRLL